MPIKGIVIILVAVVILAFIFKDAIYKYINKNFKK